MVDVIYRQLSMVVVAKRVPRVLYKDVHGVSSWCRGERSFVWQDMHTGGNHLEALVGMRKASGSYRQRNHGALLCLELTQLFVRSQRGKR